MDELDRWANIHLDLMNEISKQFYSYDDYVRLQLVCKKWSLKLPKTPNHKRNPWLVLPGVDETFETHSLEEKQIYHLRLPGMEDIFIRGSCYGWLICVLISDGTLRMLNPFTKAHFDLPPISALPHVNPNRSNIHGGDEYNVLCLRSDEMYPNEALDLHKHVIWKVVISSPPGNDNDDFMAVAIYGDCGRLAFCKHNDRRWRDIPTSGIDESFQDVTFFQEKMYALDFEVRLFEFDPKTKPLPVGGTSEVAPPSIRNITFNSSMNKYLIGCDDGGLLMVVRHLRSIEHDDGSEPPRYHTESYQFDIFKLKKNAKEWSRIYSLGNHILMIGYNFSIQMLPHTFSNGKGNQIYYTDNQVDFHSTEIATRQDIGILNLEDEDKEQLLSSVYFLCPPTWLLC